MVVDAWTQLLPPPEPGSAAEQIFRRYGREEALRAGRTADDLLREMDAAGVARAVLASRSHDAVAEAVKRHPDRFVGQAHVDPTDPDALTELERVVTTFGFQALRLEPFLYRKPPTDELYYPLFERCIALDITLQTQVGHTGPRGYPSEPGRPIYIDQVAIDFPTLRIVCGHIGWPWTEEMIAVAWKHPNVWVDTSAHVPKHFPAEFVRFMRTFGAAKCIFATDWPLLTYDRTLATVDEHLDLPPDVKQKYLHDNAVAAFKL